MSSSVPRFMLADLDAKQLAEEMVRRIPAHAPEWKNARVGDPGRAIIDLLAWMGETILYRVNLLPRRQRLEFLRLLGLKLRPADAATGIVTLASKNPAQAAAAFVPESTRLQGPVTFETVGPITVQPFEGRLYYKRRLEDAESAALSSVLDDLAELYGVDAADPYATTPLFEDGRALPKGADPLTDSIDTTIWIALLAVDESPAARSAARDAFDAQPALLNVGVIPQIVRDDPNPDEPAAALFDHFEWAISSKTLVGELEQDSYLTLEVEQDTTNQMSTEGTLRLVMPVSANVSAPVNDVDLDTDAGLGDRPPRVDDPAIAQRIFAWLRFRPKSEGGSLPLSWMGINAVQVDARETRRQILVGTSNGRPAQTMSLPAGDVHEADFVLSVQEGGKGFVRWYPTGDLGAHGRDDRVFTLDPAAGTVGFGDGLTGRLPQRGAQVRVDFMRSGGGEAGNVAAGTLTAVERHGLKSDQPAATSGGRAAETLEQAEQRVTAWLQHNDRCVTEADYRAIASDLELARVEVLPRFRPYQQHEEVAGVVSLLPLPFKAVMQPPNPRPDRRLIEQVRAHLEPRRPLGTELFVIAPDYVKVGVAVAVNIRAGFAQEQVVKAVRQALYAFLWPLTGGGRDGNGWALGQALMNLEVELITARVPGVLTSAGAAIFTMDVAGFVPVPQDPATSAQVLNLNSWQLPELMQVDIAVGANAPPTAMEDRTGLSGDGGVGIPVVPEVC